MQMLLYTELYNFVLGLKAYSPFWYIHCSKSEHVHFVFPYFFCAKYSIYLSFPGLHLQYINSCSQTLPRQWSGNKTEDYHYEVIKLQLQYILVSVSGLGMRLITCMRT